MIDETTVAYALPWTSTPSSVAIKFNLKTTAGGFVVENPISSGVLARHARLLSLPGSHGGGKSALTRLRPRTCATLAPASRPHLPWRSPGCGRLTLRCNATGDPPFACPRRVRVASSPITAPFRGALRTLQASCCEQANVKAREKNA